MDEQGLEPKAQFDSLTAQKKALWDQVVGRLSREQIRNYDFEREPEFEQISELDKQLLDLHAQIEGGNA